jgi:uncharacterized delta-60 repeat protein
MRTNSIAALLFVAGLVPGCTDPSEDDGLGGGGGKGDGSNCMGAPGEVDSCFGYQPITGVDQLMFNRTAVQTDGKIVLFGTAQDHSSATPYVYQPYVRRLLADGTPDSTFTAQLPTPSSSGTFAPAALAIRPDGRMIVGGTFGNTYAQQASVQHLTSSGSRDSTMYSASFWPPSSLLGYTTNASVNKLLLAPDDSYYAAGTIECIAAFTCDTRAMFVAHFDATGHVDTTFGKDGYALIKNGAHTQLIDATRVGDTTFVLGLETEPYYVGFQKLSFNRVVVGKLDALGALDASFGTSGVFSWYAGGSKFGTRPHAFQVQPDGSIAIATTTPTNQIVTVSSDGKTATAVEYKHDDHVMYAQFANDGSLFAEVEDYPIAAFARYAHDGTLDSTFTTAMLDVASLPPDAKFLGNLSAVEESDAWLVTAYLYMGYPSTPESELVLFRLWK